MCNFSHLVVRTRVGDDQQAGLPKLGKLELKVTLMCVAELVRLWSTQARAVDPHSFYADPDPAVFLNADPDPDPGPGPA